MTGLLAVIFATGCHGPDSAVPDGNEVIIGIFGGMGPEATADMYRNIIESTPAATDQEHIPVLIFSNPKVPDRTASIAGGGEEILPYLRFSLRKLEEAGASFIIIPCNTVHYYYDYMQESVSVPVINMIRETAAEVLLKYPDVMRVGLLATSGTISSGLYNRELETAGYEVIVPDDSVMVNFVMKAVYGIKSKTDPRVSEDLLAFAGQHLAERGAEVIVLGCTEIPLAYNPERVDRPVVNATHVLAQRAVVMYREMERGIR